MYDWVSGKWACMEAGNLLDVRPPPDSTVVEPSVVLTAACGVFGAVKVQEDVATWIQIYVTLLYAPASWNTLTLHYYRVYMDGQPAAS